MNRLLSVLVLSAGLSGVVMGQTANIPMYYLNGNIGIGNSAPVVQLQVGSGNTGTLPIDSVGGIIRPQIYNTQVTGSAGIGAMVNDGTNNRRAGLFVNQNNATWGLSSSYSSGAPSFVVLMDALEALRINPQGNIGIGNSAPAQKLDVSGNIQTSSVPSRIGLALSDTLTFDGDPIANYGVSFFNDTTASPVAGTMVALSGYRGIRFFSGGSNVMSISGAGNVGIGTATPNAKLDVNYGGLRVYQSSNTDWAAKFYNGGGDGKGVLIQAGAAGTAPILSAMDNYGNSRFYVTSAGKVGIGTNAPAELFTVQKSVYATVSPNYFVGLNLRNGLDGGNRILFSNSVAPTLAAIDGTVTSSGAGTDDGVLTFLTAINGAMGERMRITAVGNVGIGEPYPLDKLVVSGNATITGTLRANEVIVNSDSWADYVFEPGYSLRKLSDVREFVKREKHLPEVPSEAEIKRKGIDIKKMQTIQMQKIEELTLYILELEERIRALESKISR